MATVEIDQDGNVIQKEQIIQVVCDSSKEGYLLFGLGRSGNVYKSVRTGGGETWVLYIKNPDLRVKMIGE